MQQELLCNDFTLPGIMPQQPGQNHPPYHNAGMDSNLAADMAHLGLGQGSLMENLQGGNWQVCLLKLTQCPVIDFEFSLTFDDVDGHDV